MSETKSTLAAAVGYVEMSAAKRDGSTEIVRVHEAPLSEIQTYARLLENPSELVTFCCKKPKGWGDTLTDDAVFEIDAKARELNDPRLARCLVRSAELHQRAKSMVPESLVSAISSLRLQSS